MKKFIVIILVMGLLTLLSCAKKTYLSEEEMSWINTYSERDIIVFQNIATKETDTSVITKKEIYHEKYDWFRHDGYQRQTATVKYKNKALKYSPNNEVGMIGRTKRKPNEPAKRAVSYLYSTFFSDESDLKFHVIMLDSNSKTFNQVYIFNKKKSMYFDEKKHGRQPQTLYWDKEYGIIKYITYSGEVWDRINW